MGKILGGLSGYHLRPSIQICFVALSVDQHEDGDHFAELPEILKQRPRKKRTGSEQLLELIAYSTPHDAELLADCGAEAESGSARCNGIGQGHVVVVDINE